jgi:hypothetical protein
MSTPVTEGVVLRRLIAEDLPAIACWFEALRARRSATSTAGRSIAAAIAAKPLVPRTRLRDDSRVTTPESSVSPIRPPRIRLRYELRAPCLEAFDPRETAAPGRRKVNPYGRR